MVECLKKNKDVFAWSHKDIPWIDHVKANHYLNIDPTFPSIKQKQRRFALDRNKIVNNKVDRLLKIDAVEPCNTLSGYPTL